MKIMLSTFRVTALIALHAHMSQEIVTGQGKEDYRSRLANSLNNILLENLCTCCDAVILRSDKECIIKGVVIFDFLKTTMSDNL